MKLLTRFSLLAALLAMAPSMQAQNSAREALGYISTQYGPKATQWVAEIRGRGGIPQPREWDVVVFDDRAPGLLYRFRTGVGGARDMGVDRQFYPEYAPAGYFSGNQIGVDSVAAFTIAEGEARKAKMAFDSCDYTLRVRDFSTEPFWRLDLLDVRRQVVGKIYLSASSGAVLRTIWIYRDQRARPDGQPLIVDSFAPTQRSLNTGITGGETTSRVPDPGESTGIVRTVPPANGFSRMSPGQSGITGPPVVPAPQTPRTTDPPVTSVPPAGSNIYRPVDPNGQVVTSPNSIPEPPAIQPQTPAPSTSNQGMADLRDEATSTPPIEIPEGTGSTERIPPPPIPQP
ncbi:MAG: hypothetical protein AAGF67_04995 [Verrucomicrobiota bacterium]